MPISVTPKKKKKLLSSVSPLSQSHVLYLTYLYCCLTPLTNVPVQIIKQKREESLLPSPTAALLAAINIYHLSFHVTN